jgi:hypothetical protein
MDDSFRLMLKGEKVGGARRTSSCSLKWDWYAGSRWPLKCDETAVDYFGGGYVEIEAAGP